MKVMQGYYFKVTATRERFMESPLKDTSEHYVMANDYNQALDYIHHNMKHGGWTINKIESKSLNIVNLEEDN